MTHQEFAALVADMRKAQRECANSEFKSLYWSITADGFEKAVDRELAPMYQERAHEDGATAAAVHADAAGNPGLPR